MLPTATSRRPSPARSESLGIAIDQKTTLTDFGNRINVTFVDKDGNEVKLQVAEGDNLLDIAQANDLEMEGM